RVRKFAETGKTRRKHVVRHKGRTSVPLARRRGGGRIICEQCTLALPLGPFLALGLIATRFLYLCAYTGLDWSHREPIHASARETRKRTQPQRPLCCPSYGKAEFTNHPGAVAQAISRLVPRRPVQAASATPCLGGPIFPTSVEPARASGPCPFAFSVPSR